MKDRVLWISDSPYYPSGFGRVSYEIMSNLDSKQEKYDKWILSWGMKEPLQDKRGWTEVSAESPDPLGMWIKKINPKVIVISHAYFAIDNLIDKIPPSVKVLVYLVVDLSPVPKESAVNLKKVDRIVVPSLYSKHILEDTGFNDIGQIYYGVNKDIFKPLPKVNDKFGFICVQKNNIRKQLQRAIIAFAKSGLKDECNFYMVTNPIPKPEEYGAHLLDYVKNYDVQDSVIFHEYAARNASIPYKEFPEIYQKAHVNLYSGGSESFGLPFLEGTMSKCVTLSTQLPVLDELLGDSGNYFPVLAIDEYPTTIGNIKLVSIDQLSLRMKYIYENQEDAFNRMEKAYNYVSNNKDFEWRTTASKLEKEIDELL